MSKDTEQSHSQWVSVCDDPVPQPQVKEQPSEAEQQHCPHGATPFECTRGCGHGDYAVRRLGREQALSQLTADAQQQGFYEQPITAQEAVRALDDVDCYAEVAWTAEAVERATNLVRRYIEQTAQGAAQDREDK